MMKRSPRNSGSGHTFTWFKVGVLLVMLTAAGSLYTPYPAALVRVLRGDTPKPAATTAPKPTPKPAKPLPPPRPALDGEPVTWQPDSSFTLLPLELPPFPPALPERVEAGNFLHLNSIAYGINLRSNVHFTKGTTASQDRKRRDAYQVKVSLDLLLPHAADGKELLHANPRLKDVFRNYDGLMSAAKVSPWFHSLYLHKQNRIRKDAATLTNILDRHNFFDTDTLLEIQAPQSGRKALWIQADMDVVSDGSDGDRLPNMPERIRKSDNYQPSTSYRWKKRGTTPNPLLANWQARLERLQKNKAPAADIQFVKNTIYELKTFSFLLAQYDPFIVAPLTLKESRRDKDTSYSPTPGDYALVVAGNKVYPAIVGDYGPRYKTGEASLRLCKAINPQSDVNRRPVSDLGVSYIIFPGSKEPENGPIDYDRLNTRCRELLDDLGGLGDSAEFVEMKDLLAPPAPAPVKSSSGN